MLKRLFADNYKCLVNFELPLTELSLLLGPNGVGKSAVLDIIFALQQLLGGVAKVADPEIFPSHTLTRWQSVALQIVELELELEGQEVVYRLEIQHEPGARQPKVALEQLSEPGGLLFKFEQGMVQLYHDDHSEWATFKSSWTESALARVEPVEKNTKLTRFLDFMRKILVCALYPQSFRAESASEDSLLKRDGGNFAAWYRHVFQERQDLVPDYVAALRKVLDGFSGVRLEKIGQDTRAFMVVFEQAGQRYELRLDQLSDGQRALMALYALIHMTAGQGYTLFLDEPDNYLALTEIQPWLLELDDACGETVPQAVLCSHHPELIDYLAPTHGLLLDRETTGTIRARRVDTSQVENGLKLSEIVARGWLR